MTERRATTPAIGERTVASPSWGFDDATCELDAATCAALVGERAQADFYVCGPGPYMQIVQAGLEQRGVDPNRLFIEWFDSPDPAAPAPTESETESIVIRLAGRKHSVPYRPGDTVLDAARRAGLRPPFNCQAGNCGTCIAFLETGEAAMRENNVLDADEVAEGWVLTCQAVPAGGEVVVDYER